MSTNNNHANYYKDICEWVGAIKVAGVWIPFASRGEYIALRRRHGMCHVYDAGAGAGGRLREFNMVRWDGPPSAEILAALGRPPLAGKWKSLRRGTKRLAAAIQQQEEEEGPISTDAPWEEPPPEEEPESLPAEESRLNPLEKARLAEALGYVEDHLTRAWADRPGTWWLRFTVRKDSPESVKHAAADITARLERNGLQVTILQEREVIAQDQRRIAVKFHTRPARHEKE